MHKQIILLLLTITLLTSCRFAPKDSTPPPTATEPASPSPAASIPAPAATLAPTTQSLDPVLNLRYSDEPVEDPRQLSLDVYPLGTPDHPVLIFVHGGEWYRGTKSNVDAKPQAFYEHGFVFVTINYRLYPDVTISQQMGDVAAAIAWVKNNIDQYGGDPNRIFIMGHSAGAHLVSLVATDESYLKAEGLSLTDLRGVISLDSQAYDLTTFLLNLPETNGQVYRAVFGDDPENWKKFSPITYVSSGRGIPPFFLVYTSEKPGRSELTQLFAQALEKAGISATVQSAVEETHGQVNSQFGVTGNPVSEAAFRWLEEILGGL